MRKADTNFSLVGPCRSIPVGDFGLAMTGVDETQLSLGLSFIALGEASQCPSMTEFWKYLGLLGIVSKEKVAPSVEDFRGFVLHRTGLHTGHKKGSQGQGKRASAFEQYFTTRDTFQGMIANTCNRLAVSVGRWRCG